MHVRWYSVAMKHVVYVAWYNMIAFSMHKRGKSFRYIFDGDNLFRCFWEIAVTKTQRHTEYRQWHKANDGFASILMLRSLNCCISTCLAKGGTGGGGVVTEVRRWPWWFCTLNMWKLIVHIASLRQWDLNWIFLQNRQLFNYSFVPWSHELATTGGALRKHTASHSNLMLWVK